MIMTISGRSRHFGAKKGFTLIELLVVIAIIAMLLAILVPSLKRAKQQALAVIDLSRLKQWGTLYKLYADDYKDHLPSGWNSKKMWMTNLMSYYQNTDELRLCPSATKFLSETPGATPGEFTAWGVYGENSYPVPYWGERGMYGSYSVNGWALDPLEVGLPETYSVPKGSPYYDFYWRKNTIARSPSQVPLMGDGMWEGANALDSDPAALEQGKEAAPLNAMSSAGVSSYCLDRHDGGPNWLFMDGQVRKVGMKELWSLKWHTKWTIKSRQWPAWMSKYPDY
jgi:prepilin-type N-terminal cleavage/methylation domain-containing protein/prepilin-type processing-associated H-X9-DG protein